MVTNRIDLANLSAKDSALLMQLFKANKYKSVYLKNTPHHFRCFDAASNKTVDYTIELSNDIVRRLRNRDHQTHRYEVIANSDKVGSGGFSQVFAILCTLAIDNNQLIMKRNKERVVKVQEFTKEELSDLSNEYLLTQQTRHIHMKEPAVVKTDDDRYVAYLVMRRLHGTSLYDVITQLYSNSLDMSCHQRMTMIIALLTQLKELHANGIIHRDLKPDNVMTDLNSGELTIFDFGLSKAANVDDTGLIQGTPGYIPPEIYAGMGSNEKSDVFSMAVIIGMLWYADEPGKEADDVTHYAFQNIFNDDKLDLSEQEKTQILTLLKRMTKNNRDERCTVDDALQTFTDIRDNYVNRKIAEMVANRPTLYRLENGLFFNNAKKKDTTETHPAMHSCRF